MSTYIILSRRSPLIVMMQPRLVKKLMRPRTNRPKPNTQTGGEIVGNPSREEAAPMARVRVLGIDSAVPHELARSWQTA
jgi:hypothetical protein